LFEKLFISDSPERQARRAQENQMQASILDSVLEEANRLSKKVNQEDKAKLDEYLTSVRDVEKRLELRQRWTNQPKPKAPFDKPANRNAVEDLPLLYELIALALQTDSTAFPTTATTRKPSQASSRWKNIRSSTSASSWPASRR
jgi:hypothetical protein